MNPLSCILLLSLSLLPACRQASPEGADPVPSSPHHAALTIKGSDTMVHLVSAWAEHYRQTPGAAQVSVTGGGTGTGFAALINGTTDICAASRPIQEKEQQQAKEKGITPQQIVVARDAIVVIVHPHNPVTTMTMPQVAAIFTGTVDTWQAVGGGKEAILPLSRESSSGTYVFFQEHVLKKADYTVRARLMPGTSAMAQAVAADEPAIGYTGLGYAVGMGEAIRMVAIKKDEAAPAVTPSEETVSSGAYPISRELYLYTNGEPGAQAKPFIDFCLSPAGQEIVRQTGYVAVATP